MSDPVPAPTSPCRVLEVTQRYPPALGGVERQVEALARELVTRGYSVRVVTTDLARDHPFTRLGPTPPGVDVPVARRRAVRLLPAPHGLGIAAPAMAFDVLARDVDVVHAHAFGMAPTWFGVWARRVRSTPLIIEAHADAGRATSGSATYQRMVTRFTLRPADRTVAHTPTERDLLVQWGLDPARVIVIPNGIDLTDFDRLPRRTAAPGQVTALFVGRLSPEQKGLEPLVRALARVPRALGLHVRFVGEDWGGASVIRRTAAELDVTDLVELVGPCPRPALLQEYANADLFVLPSLFEPFGVVLLEAMGAGLPIVASRVGGIPDVVAEGETALLVPPNDPEALAGALAQVAEDPGLRARLGRAGRARVEQFSWEQVMPRWTTLLNEVARLRRAA